MFLIRKMLVTLFHVLFSFMFPVVKGVHIDTVVLINPEILSENIHFRS